MVDASAMVRRPQDACCLVHPRPGRLLPVSSADDCPEMRGDGALVDQAFLATYRELRQLAQALFVRERAGNTLQATALVNEAYLRLRASGEIDAAHPERFRRVAALAMRRILISHARSKRQLKRGGGHLPQCLDSVELASAGALDEVLAVDEAIETLAAEAPDLAEIVRLRFYAGLEMSEIASTLGQSERTVDRDWSYAQTRLYQLLSEGR